MSEKSLVSVICLCHNQANYVAEAIQSVWDQDHKNVELIVVDDASTDESKNEIVQKLEGTNTTYISLDENIGNCKAFNLGFKESKGSYIIDLAADDALLSTRISEGIKSFTENIGVTFCDASLISKNGLELGSHYPRDESGNLIQGVPEGNVYIHLIQKYFISPPTMMIKRVVLEELGGYDETLTYEDFDFWIRSSRNWKYSFTNLVLVKKRMVKNSHSTKQFKLLSKHQKSTLEVCKKIKGLNKNKEEHLALKKRCWYEIRQCIRMGNWHLIPSFYQLI